MAGITYNLSSVYDSAYGLAMSYSTAANSSSLQAINAVSVSRLPAVTISAAAPIAQVADPTLTKAPTIKSPALIVTDNTVQSLSALERAASSVENDFDAVKNRMVQSLEEIYREFLTTYFPVEPATLAANDWLAQQLAEGGAGINQQVERELWERDRVRVGTEFQRASSELAAVFSARRFPMPPGAMAHQTNVLMREQLRELAKTSRERTLETYRAELDLVKFAVQQSVNLRFQAMQAAGEYLRTLTIGGTLSQQLLQTSVSARTAAVQAATSYFQAQVQMQDIAARTEIAGAQLQSEIFRAEHSGQISLATAKIGASTSAYDSQLRANISQAQVQADLAKASLSADIAVAAKKADAAIAAAQTSGTLAAAALNGFGVRFSYGESNDVTGTT